MIATEGGQRGGSSELAALAATSYRSVGEALEAVFGTMRRLLNMRSVFLTRIDGVRGTLQLVAVANAAGGCGLETGDPSPLEQHY